MIFIRMNVKTFNDDLFSCAVVNNLYVSKILDDF